VIGKVEKTRERSFMHYTGTGTTDGDPVTGTTDHLVYIYTEYVGTFFVGTCSTVSDFPFDAYDCCIHIISSNFVKPSRPFIASDDIKFASYIGNRKREVNQGDIWAFDLVHDEWSIFKMTMKTEPMGPEKNPSVLFCFRIERNIEVHFTNGFLIIFIITLMNFTAFGIDPSEVYSRLSFAATIALTLVALKFNVETDMPKSSRSNWIQKYNQFCILFTLALMILFAYEVQRDKEDWRFLQITITLFIGCRLQPAPVTTHYANLSQLNPNLSHFEPSSDYWKSWFFLFRTIM
jgi:hypothetical protein